MKKPTKRLCACWRRSLPHTLWLRYARAKEEVLMRPISFALCVVVASLIVMGCGGDSGTPATDTNTTQDAGQNDVAQVDTGTADTGTEDAGMVDSGAVDAAPADAAPADAASADAGMPDAGMPVDAGGIEPVSFTTVFNEVLNPKGCTGGYCHAGHAGGLLMDSIESAYDNLVNKESSTPTDCEATMRVVPGDPDASMLWIRVRPNADDCLTPEQKMPAFGEEGLSAEELKLIHDWILTGANP
jgi:hypothetical protein